MSHPHPQPRFILASASPRRQELLELLGLTFTVIRPEDTSGKQATAIDETPLPGESPPALVQRLSRVKAQAVAKSLADRPNSAPEETRQAVIIAADTIVVLNNEILGKPAGPTQAGQMLRRLRQSRFHYVYSGITVARRLYPPAATPRGPRPDPALQLVTRLHRSQVWMRPYTNAEIEAYVAGGDPLDKAGAYAIQHPTFAPVERLEGCFASVMGLPLGELAAALAEFGITLPPVGPACARYSGYPCCQLASAAG